MPTLACPLCRHPLARDGRTWRCAQGHAFDTAREGYLNLLPVQHKKSRAPGDNDAMVRARREFLEAGHYAPLRDAVLAALRPLGARTLLDLGCGEGWYTRALAGVVPDVVALDIAKEAVRLAAKRDPRVTWLVASAAQLPLPDGAVDLACSLFSPLPAAELARVLVPGGHLLVATPAPRHLWSLRAALFEEVREHAPGKFVAELERAGFALHDTVDVAFPLALDNTALRQLLAMTPYAWRATPERRTLLEAQAHLDTEAAFTLLLFRRA